MGSTPDADRSYEPDRTVCPFCGVGCGIRYDEPSGKGTGWEAPVNERGEVCPKGVAAFEAGEHADRLTEPLVRENGRLVTAPWEEALSRIADAFGDVRAEHGPDALAFFASSTCTNEENYLVGKLARALGTNNVDNCARLCHSSTVTAMAERLGIGAMTNTLDDLAEADAFLVTGANPAEQHPVAFQSYIGEAVSDGATLIHVDPRANETTDQADVHLPVSPGYDIPLLNAMAKVIVDAGLVDEAFVSARTERYDAFVDHLADVDVDANAERAGVDADGLRAAAEAYGSADRAAILTGMGMSQHHCGTDNVRALVNLALLTGHLGERGTGINPLRGQNNVQGANDVGARPADLPGYRPVESEEARGRLADVWGFEPPSDPGLTEVEMTHEFGDGIRAAYVFGENPAVSEPNATAVEDGLDDLDFLVVHDLFVTETAEYADVVLPGSAWSEKEGSVTNTDRQVQRVRPNASLPGNARRDFDIVRAVGRRLTDVDFDYEGPAAVFDEMTAVNPLYAGMSYDALGESGLRWPFPEGAEEGRRVLHRETFFDGERTTPFVPVDHVPPADDLGDDQLALTTGRVLQHFNTGAVSRRSATLVRMYDEDFLRIHPRDAEERGITDGDQVVVENDRGSVTVTADVTPAITPGSVFLTFHYDDPLTNALTGDVLDPDSKIPEYKHSAVRVAPST
ncbi:MAG: formate dehydrogenase subunit alpha [Haloplanus sp.]